MPPKSNVPIRIGGSKTRTGCRTCKNRHVKCDEQRPICARCQKANRQCVYDQPQTQAIQRAHDYGRTGGFAMPMPLCNHNLIQFPTLSRSPSPYGPRDPHEVNATMHFAVHLAKELAGCFSDDVWCQILPRVAQVEPSIWHAMAAIGALDTGIRLGGDEDQGSAHMSMAIRQYSKAIQGLSTRLQSGDHTYRKDVILISCILFAVFECMQSHIQSALLHISSGTKLLLEWIREARIDEQANAGSYLNQQSLLPVFLALDSQAIQMGAVGFREHLYSPAEDNHLQAPRSFATVEEAHVLLSYIFNRISHWAQFVEPVSECENKPDADWLMKERRWLQGQLAKWDSAFNSSLRNLYPQPPILLLLIQRTVMQAFFDKQVDGPSEMTWDNYFLLFQRAVGYAEEFMMYDQSEYKPPQTTSVPRAEHFSASKFLFTVNMDIVLPLFLISTKCRDRDLRRRALRILKISGRKEGLWDSYKCAVMAERMIELEEAGAAEDGTIPESARIHMLDVTLGEETGAEVVHKKLIQDEAGNHHAEPLGEVTTW